MITDGAAIPHAHDLSAVEAEIIRIDANRAADLAAANALAARVLALEDRPVIVPGPSFEPDFHIAPWGSDTADGRTRATAWRSATKAPANAVTALWDGGDITGGAVYDRAVHLVTAPGVHARIKGPGQYSLRLQRAHGSTIHPGAGGSITAVTAADPLEPTINGEKPGASRRACVQLTDTNDLDLELRVVAGSDIGILATNVLRSTVVADVSDAGHGVHLKGNLGTGADRSWFSGHVHDCNRMIRRTAKAGDDYGGVGWVFEGSTGGGLRDWTASRCYAASIDYTWDGGGLEGYDATDALVLPGTVTDCECGMETGGSAGKGIARWVVDGLRLRGSMTRSGRSPGVLVRNFADSTLTFDADVSAARVVLEVYQDAGQFGGSIAGSTIRGVIVQRPGVLPTSLRDVPPSTTVTVEVVQP